MFDLKELFTESQATVRRAQPPAGQWETIEQQLKGAYSTGGLTGPAPASSVSSSGFLTGFGTGIGVGAILTTLAFLVVLITQNALTEEQPQNLTATSPEVTENRTSTVRIATIERAILVGLEPLSSTIKRPSVKEISFAPTSDIHETPPLRTGLLDSFSGTPEFSKEPLEYSVQSTSGPVAYGNLSSGNFPENPMPATAVEKLPGNIFQLGGSDLELMALDAAISPPDTTFKRGSGRKSRWHFEPTPLRQDPSPYWEAGLHASPWLSSSSYFDGPDEYTSHFPGSLSSGFVLANGETVQLARVRPLDEFYQKKLYVNQLHLEGSRQLGNGLRFGAGLLWEDYSRGDFGQAGAFAAQVPDDGWLYLAEDEYKILSATLSAGYTFRRRMRLRYSVGLMAAGQLYGLYTERSALLDKSTGVLHPQRILTNENGHFLPTIGLRPTFGVQYQLARNLSVGLEVTTGLKGFKQVPEVGIGGRWQIR